MNLPLPGGGTAELRDRLTYGQAQPVYAAMVAASKDSAALVTLPMTLVQAYVVCWDVLDPDGKAVSLDDPESAPDDVVQAISVAALDLWNRKADPNAGAAPSRTTRQARQSSRRTGS